MPKNKEWEYSEMELARRFEDFYCGDFPPPEDKEKEEKDD